MKFDTDVLKSFVVLADELHFGRAASRLHIEQPALSQRIQRLERTIKVQLFDRDTRKVQLTAAGSAFLEDAAGILALVDNAVRRAQRVQSGEPDLLQLAYTFSVGYETLPLLLAGVEPRECSIEALEMWEKDVVSAVMRHSRDVGLVRFRPANSELRAGLLRRERLVLAVPVDHRLADRHTVRIAELAEDRFVATPETLTPGHRTVIDEIFTNAGIDPVMVPNPIPGGRVMIDLSRSGAVSLVPASVRHLYSVGSTVFLPIEDDFAFLPVYLIRRADAGPAVDRFVARAEEIARARGWVR